MGPEFESPAGHQKTLCPLGHGVFAVGNPKSELQQSVLCKGFSMRNLIGCFFYAIMKKSLKVTIWKKD